MQESKEPTVFVVIPTYNERENIEELCGRLLQSPLNLHLVVVDDGSPDGTGEWVEERSREEPRLHALRRPGKLGFASAVIAGFRYALEHGADVVLEMDADLSHDPAAIPQFLEKLQRADVVIGSRYIPGGGTRNWGLFRRWLSRGANQFARMLLGLKVRDCTSGYRCYRRQVLESIDFDRIHTEGYAFLIQMVFLCQRKGYRIEQVPILFVDRRAGRSKLSRRIIWEALGLVLRLAWERWRRYAT